MIDGALYVNDWMTGDVFQYQNKHLIALFNAGKHAGDISAKGNVLLVPMMFSKGIDAYQIK